MKFLIVGAGLSGSVIGRQIAEAGHHVTIIDQRSHIGGNCYTKIDSFTGITEHVYGPHIFHTDNREVWDYINKFGEFVPYINRVKTTYNGNVYSLPVNLHTINQFYSKCMSPTEAKNFISSISDQTIHEPKSFEEQAHKFIGKDLYNAFFRGYTLKQWGISPSNLPASILKRLPVRFNYDDNYFNHEFQAIPKDGYTKIFENLLDHKNINFFLSKSYLDFNNNSFDHIIWTGKLDEYFDFELGELSYRTLKFEKNYADGDFQGVAVMNYGDDNIPYTRISEHKYFTPWEKFEKTIYFKEYSFLCTKNDIPYYPIRLVGDQDLLDKYIARANLQKNVTFAGRLATYKYMDMDVTIAEALKISKGILTDISSGNTISPFYSEEVFL